MLQLAEHLREAGRDDEITQVTANDVRGFLTELERRGMKPSSLYSRYSGCRQFFAWCVREGELEVSPMAAMRPPKVPEVRIAMLTRDQLKALLADCTGTDLVSRRDTAIISLLADTGMRLSELAGLTVHDIDGGGRVAHVVGKGSRLCTVPFGARTALSFDRYLRARRQHARADRPNLWLGEKNRVALTSEGVKQMLQRRGQSIGVHVHAHMFRHMFADGWLDAGGNEGDLMQLAGGSPRRWCAAMPPHGVPSGPVRHIGDSPRWTRCEASGNRLVADCTAQRKSGYRLGMVGRMDGLLLWLPIDPRDKRAKRKAVGRYVSRRPLDVEAAVAELRKIANGGGDLLAERAGITLGFYARDNRDEWSRKALQAALLIAAGADLTRLTEWIEEGQQRAERIR